jgi:hypothetical protein
VPVGGLSQEPDLPSPSSGRGGIGGGSCLDVTDSGICSDASLSDGGDDARVGD